MQNPRSRRDRSSVTMTMATFSGFLPFFGNEMTFRIGRMRGTALLSGLLALGACTATPTVVENSATAVTVRYDGIANNIDDASQVAQKACAAHGKSARLRNVSDQGLGQHYGHFNCV